MGAIHLRWRWLQWVLSNLDEFFSVYCLPEITLWALSPNFLFKNNASVSRQWNIGKLFRVQMLSPNTAMSLLYVHIISNSIPHNMLIIMTPAHHSVFSLCSQFSCYFPLVPLLFPCYNPHCLPSLVWVITFNLNTQSFQCFTFMWCNQSKRVVRQAASNLRF